MGRLSDSNMPAYPVKGDTSATDVFRRPDLSGLAKVLWVLAIIWLPIIGLVAYFVTRPDDVEPIFD